MPVPVTASASGLAGLRALSISHHTAGVARLQHLAFDCEASRRLHADLTARDIESVVIQTCNRTEVYWRAQASTDDERVSSALAAAAGTTEAHIDTVAARLSGDAAAAHLFRVCCGLESMVLGEAEILGQVRTALDACPGAGPFLEGVVRAALRTGRQARAETAIGAGAMSVASAGVQWLGAQVDLAASRVLVLGAGDTATTIARLLQSLGAREIVIANRTVSHAQSLAALVGGTAVGLDALPEELTAADAVMCAAATPEWLVTRAELQRGATRSPIALVDLSMPAAVEPGDVGRVTRIDLAGLEHVADGNRRQRAAEIPRVEAVIARELSWLHAWARHHTLRPLVSDLRRKVEAIRRAELARASAELATTDAAHVAVLDRLSRRLLNQILAIPLAQLQDGRLPLDSAHADYLRQLFALTHAEMADGAGQ